MHRNDVGAFRGLFGRGGEDETFGLDPVPVARPGVYGHHHAEGQREFRHLAANVAIADDGDPFAFDLLGRELRQVSPGIELPCGGEPVQIVHGQVGQHLQQGLEAHLRGGAAVE